VYDVSFPKFVGRGIFFGSQVFEKIGKQEIKCEKTGYIAKLEYLSGKKVIGQILNPKGEVEITIDGDLSQKVVYKFEKLQKAVVVTPQTMKMTKKTVEPVAKQKENESRRVWHPVTFNIVKGDLSAAGRR
jgi:cytochrome c oxidase assembly protein Cox11